MKDTLCWIRSYKPGTQKAHFGLNLHGITLITAPDLAAEVFEDWASLFSHAPAQMKLRRGHVFTVGKPESGRWEYLQLERDKVVRDLRALSACCRQAAASQGEEYVLHLGI